MQEEKLESERKQITKVWLFAILLVVIAIVIFGALALMGKFSGTFVDRMVMETSYQKVHADKTANKMYSAEMAEIDGLLIGETDPITIKRLKAKKASLRILMQSKG